MISNGPRLAALALGACLTIGCADKSGEREGAVDTAGGAVASAPVTSGAGTGSMESSTEPRNDAEIMTLVAQSNHAEVASSELAVKNAASAAVKAFAREMIADHSAMLKQGAQVATKLGVEPTGSDSTQGKADAMNDDMSDLKGRTGADFDKAYVDMQVQAHQKTLDDLRSFQAKAQNAELKAMLTGAIPKVEAHLQKAQQLQSQVNTRS